MSTPQNIHPTFGQLLGREAKETLLNQRGLVVWLYGLSGSGKSTLATALERRLHEEGVFTQVLDGDNIRPGLKNSLSQCLVQLLELLLVLVRFVHALFPIICELRGVRSH